VPDVSLGILTTHVTNEVVLWRKATVIDKNRKIAIAVMWGSLVFLGIPGLAIATVNSARSVPIAIALVVGGNAVGIVVTLLVGRSSRRVLARGDDSSRSCGP